MTVVQDAGSPGHSKPTCCYAELAASFTNFLHYCLQSSGFYGAITEADAQTIRLNAPPSGLSVPPLPSSPIFTSNALSGATLLIYSGLGQAPNNAGMHTQLAWHQYYQHDTKSHQKTESVHSLLPSGFLVPCGRLS